MMKIVLLSFLLFSVAPVKLVFAENKECKQRIFFLPQAHLDAFSSVHSNLSIEEVAKSQFKIAKLLLQNSRVPIFSEEIDTNISIEDLEKPELKEAIETLRKNFPSGLNSFEDLSGEQKQMLARAGAGVTLLALGKIPRLYKVVPDRETQDQLFAEIKVGLEKLKQQGETHVELNSPLLSLIENKRERLALEEIKDYFSKYPEQKDVILVYGGLHRFGRYPDLFRSDCVLVPSDFQMDLK